MKKGNVMLLVLLAAAAVVIGVAASVIHRGFSAHEQPSVVESYLFFQSADFTRSRLRILSRIFIGCIHWHRCTTVDCVIFCFGTAFRNRVAGSVFRQPLHSFRSAAENGELS